MKLYSYWCSTTSYRLRAALNLKELPCETVSVDLVAGAQHSPEYTAPNPGGGVPALVLKDGTVLTQSLAILDYLDAVATPRLLPQDPVQRARVMACAHAVALNIHPVKTLRMSQHLQQTHGVAPEQTKAWMLHWITEGFTAVEAMVSQNNPFAFRTSPDLADLCTVEQLHNAHPENQPDAPH